MKDDIILNDAEQRQANRALRTAKNHQEKIERTYEEDKKTDNPKKGLNFSNAFKFLKKKETVKEVKDDVNTTVSNEDIKQDNVTTLEPIETPIETIKETKDDVVVENTISEENKESNNKPEKPKKEKRKQ